MNIPNRLSILRMCMIPVFAVFFFLDGYVPYNYFISAVIFALAAFTDFLDGYIARKYHLVTNLGKFLDPIADKVLVATALIFMCCVPEILPSYFAIAVAVILARELIVSGFRMQAASRGIVLAADKIGKVKTVFQDLAIFVLLIGYDFFGVKKASGLFGIINIIGLSLLGIAAVLTIISGVNYIVKNRQVLSDKEDRK